MLVRIKVNICEKYASEFDIYFSGRKSELAIFKERLSNGLEPGVMVNRLMVNISDKAVHLGHTISSSDLERISMTAICSFYIGFINFTSVLDYTHHFIKCSLFKQFCCSFYGSPLWHLNGPDVIIYNYIV